MGVNTKSVPRSSDVKPMFFGRCAGESSTSARRCRSWPRSPPFGVNGRALPQRRRPRTLRRAPLDAEGVWRYVEIDGSRDTKEIPQSHAKRMNCTASARLPRLFAIQKRRQSKALAIQWAYVLEDPSGFTGIARDFAELRAACVRRTKCRFSS